MPLAISCPHCEVKPIETVRHAWYIMGFLLFASYGSTTYVGCVSCTRNKVIGSFALSSLMGWWCFPWGLGTPFVMLQNIVAITGGEDEQAVRTLLAQQGMDYDELLVDEHGRSAGETKLVEGIMATLHIMVWADGSADEREIEVGVDIATRMLGDSVNASEVAAILKNPESPGELDPSGFEMDHRVILLKAAGMIAAADGDIAEEEIDEMQLLGQRLELPSEIVSTLIEMLQSELEPDEEQDQMKAIAADALGVPVDAPLTAIQTAYQKALMDMPEDEEEAAEHRQSLDWAYQTLMGLPIEA